MCDAGQQEGFISKAEYASIFGKLEPIRKLHEEILKELTPLVPYSIDHFLRFRRV